jgi:ABC-type anion transport system duplicated permease subunit
MANSFLISLVNSFFFLFILITIYQKKRRCKVEIIEAIEIFCKISIISFTVVSVIIWIRHILDLKRSSEVEK